jgi:hypothetical protein
MKSGVQGTGINEVCKSKLFDSPEPLKVRMINEVVNNFEGYGYEPVDRVVKDLQLVGKFIHSCKYNKLFRSGFNAKIMSNNFVFISVKRI